MSSGKVSTCKGHTMAKEETMTGNQDNLNNRPLLFISFFCGIRGNCPAEWADDKIRVLEQAGRKVIVLTGMPSHVTNRPGVTYIRVPSLSWNDYKYEIDDIRLEKASIPFMMWVFMPFAFLLGGAIDFVLRKVTKGISSGRWSWIITSFPVALWLKIRYGIRDIFCTGGPTAAHIIGGGVAKLSGAHLYCEFQDPLLGATMTRSSMTRKIASLIETWMVKNSQKAIYVTKVAANGARDRNPQYAANIIDVYPGAWKFLPSTDHMKIRSDEHLEFLHLGTLYGTRNLDVFFKALDELHEEGFVLANKVRVVNLGAIYCDTVEEYMARPDFQLLEALEREDALKRAQMASCLLLVQHTDERSQETIPYKTYDYLNLNLPVLGLLNNDELRDLIESCGGFAAQAGDINSMKSTLKSCLHRLSETKAGASQQIKSYDISHQFLQIFE